MKSGFGMAHEAVAGFPYQSSPRQTKTALPIPPVNFTERKVASLFNNEIKIYVSPDTFLVTKLRDIFQQTKLKHTTVAESMQWLGGPKMKYIYWPQQVNFAVFCAT